MKRTLVAAALAVTAIFASAPAGAVVSTTTQVNRAIVLNWGEFTPVSYVNGYLQVEQRVNASSADAAVTPTADFVASGYVYSETFDPCCSATVIDIHQQAVSPTALNMDALGNSARFSATLASNAGPQVFDLTFAQPASLQYGQPCTNGCANAWHDPNSNAFRLSNYNVTGITRWDYRVSGSAAGTLMTPGFGQFSASFTTASAQQVLSAP